VQAAYVAASRRNLTDTNIVCRMKTDVAELYIYEQSLIPVAYKLEIFRVTSQYVKIFAKILSERTALERPAKHRHAQQHG